MNKNKLIEMLIRHEGLHLKPYKCPSGFITIGVGRNLETKGISQGEAIMLLQHDIEDAEKKLNTIPIFKKLSENRKAVLIDMCINLGFQGLQSFKKMWIALEQNKFDIATAEMLNSKWHEQVGNRAIELAHIMFIG